MSRPPLPCACRFSGLILQTQFCSFAAHHQHVKCHCKATNTGGIIFIRGLCLVGIIDHDVVTDIGPYYVVLIIMSSGTVGFLQFSLCLKSVAYIYMYCTARTRHMELDEFPLSTCSYYGGQLCFTEHGSNLVVQRMSRRVKCSMRFNSCPSSISWKLSSINCIHFDLKIF